MANTDPIVQQRVLNFDNARVYTEYDPSSPPPHPGVENYTRFVCLSDTHSHRFFVPDGDVLIHAGDLTRKGNLTEFEAAATWIRELPHRTKIVIAGNHDLLLDPAWYREHWSRFHKEEQDTEDARSAFKGPASRNAGLVYLQYEGHSFQAKEGGRMWKVYGFPGSQFFRDWAFNYKPGQEAQELIPQIPLDTDILITHGPAYRMMDKTNTNVNAGSPELLEHVSRVRPILHVFGHIHEGRGVASRQWPDEERKSTIFVNAANQPSGRNRRRGLGGLGGFGGLGFRPIIIDIRDPVRSSGPPVE